MSGLDATFVIYLFLVFCSVKNQQIDGNINENLKDNDLIENSEDQIKQEQIKIQIQKYIKEKRWKPEKVLDKNLFIKTFIKIFEKSVLEKYNTSILKKVAEILLKRYGEPVIVKNLEKYFILEEIYFTYSQYLQAEISDL